FLVGPEADRRAGVALADRADDFQLLLLFAVGEPHRIFVAVAAHPDLQLLRQRVDHRYADAVQAAGVAIALVAELRAGVQAGEDDLDAAHAFFRVAVDRHAAAVVGDGDGVVVVQRDDDLIAIAGDRLVGRVVDHFL